MRRLALWATVAAGAGAVGASYLRGRRVIDKHVADYALHWSKRTSIHAEGVLHYVALGDSAAQGVGASDVAFGYVPTIARRLAEATGREVVVTNLSISGAVTSDVVEFQLDPLAALPFTPDVVTLDIGANDVIFGRAAQYPALLEQVLAALPEGSYVGDVPWMILPGWAGKSVAMSRLAADAVARHGHHLVEIHAMTRGKGYLRFAQNTAKDWFHPNDTGYALWADTFWTAIEASGVLERLRKG